MESATKKQKPAEDSKSQPIDPEKVVLPNEEELKKWQKEVVTALDENVVPFWMKHSLDHEYGGYYNHLGREGEVFSTTKNIWLQGRQVFMLARLYNAYPNKYHTPEMLKAAQIGADFLMKYVKTTDHFGNKNRCYFSVSREGKPIWMQRKIFAETFYVLGLAEYAKASQQSKYRDEALAVFDSVLQWSRNPHAWLGRDTPAAAAPALSENGGGDATSDSSKSEAKEKSRAARLQEPAKVSEMNVPMILLNLIIEMELCDDPKYTSHFDWCIEEILKHVKPEKKVVLEIVQANGEPLTPPSPESRMVMPGHALECAWFLLQAAEKLKDRNRAAKIINQALDVTEWMCEKGWDNVYGGLYYFTDAENLPVLPLEWNMKLWWVHNEAMIALLWGYMECLKAGDTTRAKKMWGWYQRVGQYTMEHFPDGKNEWYGYLDRQGLPSHTFKAGPYKGFFHVPRALYMLDELFGRILKLKN